MAYIITLQDKQALNMTLQSLNTVNKPILVVEKFTNYSVADTDYRKLIVATRVITLTLPNCTALQNGFHFFVKNNSSGDITLVPYVNTQRIDNTNKIVMSPNESLICISNSEQYYTFHAAGWIAS